MADALVLDVVGSDYEPTSSKYHTKMHICAKNAK
jgi:hypothetical protein